MPKLSRLDSMSLPGQFLSLHGVPVHLGLS